jgi:DNA-binding transcriptional MocR family regulator
LLDKVVARRIMEALLKLASAQDLTAAEIAALRLYERADAQGVCLFMAPPTQHILQRLAPFASYAPLVALFRARVEVALPTRYFKRWSRRLRDQGFAREDAAVLALGTFGTNPKAEVFTKSSAGMSDIAMRVENRKLCRQRAGIRRQE